MPNRLRGLRGLDPPSTTDLHDLAHTQSGADFFNSLVSPFNMSKQFHQLL